MRSLHILFSIVPKYIKCAISGNRKVFICMLHIKNTIIRIFNGKLPISNTHARTKSQHFSKNMPTLVRTHAKSNIPWCLKIISKSKETAETCLFTKSLIWKNQQITCEISANSWGNHEITGHLSQSIKQKFDKLPTNKYADWRNPGSLTRA